VWNIEAFNHPFETVDQDGVVYHNSEASLLASGLHPFSTPSPWDILILVESGTRRLEELTFLANTDDFEYEHQKRPGAYSKYLGVLIIWKKKWVTRYSHNIVRIASTSGALGEFAYLAVPLTCRSRFEYVGWRYTSKSWGYYVRYRTP
jgi:hypothetical protein